MVRSAYRGWHVALLLDEDSCHTARASVQTAENMTLRWLPTRAPKLNPIETLWGQAKDVVSVNKQYATIDEQAQRFVAHPQGMSNQEALSTSGVLSKNFWLRAALRQTSVHLLSTYNCNTKNVSFRKGYFPFSGGC